MSIEQKLKDFLDDSGVSYRVGAKSFVMNCPACGKEEHFYLFRQGGSGICFRCGHRDGWAGVVATIASISIHDAKALILGHGSGDAISEALPRDLFDPIHTKEITYDPIRMGLDFLPVESSIKAIEYLASRGVTDPEKILRYDLRYHVAMDAVVFPVSKEGKLYGWQARRIPPIEDGALRLISMQNFQKTNFLLNYDWARTKEAMCLVEGPFDCLSADTDKVGAVASLGKSVSPQQVYLIKQAGPKRLYIGLDDDAASEVYEVVERMGLDIELFRTKLPDGKDFGDSSRQEVEVSYQEALRVDSGGSILEAYMNGPIEVAIRNGG